MLNEECQQKKIWKNFKRNFVQLTERVLDISDWFINASYFLMKNFETSIPFLRPFWALGLFGVCGLSYFWAWAFRALMLFVFQVFAHLDFWDFRLSGLWSFGHVGFESVGFLWDKKWNTIAIVMTTLATPLSEQLTTQTFQVLALINLNDLSPSFNRLFLPFGFYLEKCQHT